jgi:hypothetical protein
LQRSQYSLLVALRATILLWISTHNRYRKSDLGCEDFLCALSHRQNIVSQSKFSWRVFFDCVCSKPRYIAGAYDENNDAWMSDLTGEDGGVAWRKRTNMGSISAWCRENTPKVSNIVAWEVLWDTFGVYLLYFSEIDPKSGVKFGTQEPEIHPIFGVYLIVSALYHTLQFTWATLISPTRIERRKKCASIFASTEWGKRRQ